MKQVLISKELYPLFLSIMQFLNRANITIRTAATTDEILKCHFEQHADLIILKIDQPGTPCETMIHIIRRSESLRGVSILACHDDRPALRERSEVSGANAAIALPANPSRLAAKVLQLLDVQPRRAYRVVMNMTADGLHNGKPFLCKTENVSTRGMLLSTAEALAPGNHISCSFYLPDGTRVVADGEVVRVIGQNSASPSNQYGIRFLTISPQSEAALDAFVQKQRKSASTDETQDALVA